MGTGDVSRCQNAFMVGAPIVSMIAFIVVCFFNFLAGQDADLLEWGIYRNNTGEISDKYYLEITPAGWTFSIWGFIYTYQTIFLVYWLTLLCRKNRSTGEPLYRSPVFMSPWIGVFYVLNMLCNLSWTFAWDREKMPIAFALLLLTTLTLYTCIGFSFYGLAKNKHDMLDQRLGIEIRLVIGIVHNGLGMYAAWVSIATLLNFTHVLVYEEYIGLNQHIGSSICLSILACEIVVFMFLDHTFLERYFGKFRHMRYLFTPYIVLNVALIGSLAKNWDSNNSNSIFTVGLLAICGFASVMKILLAVQRTRRTPLYSPVP